MNPAGVLSGGWEFVIAAYVLSFVVLTSYALSVVLRYRAEVRRAARERKNSEASL